MKPNRRDRTQSSGLRVRALWALAIAGISGLVGCLGSGGCSAGELAVLEEIPRYDGREIEPGPVGPGFASCSVRYPANASKEEILAYYSEWLHENGWETELQGASILDARRDGYRYRVDYRGRIQPASDGDTTIEDIVLVRVSSKESES